MDLEPKARHGQRSTKENKAQLGLTACILATGILQCWVPLREGSQSLWQRLCGDLRGSSIGFAMSGQARTEEVSVTVPPPP